MLGSMANVPVPRHHHEIHGGAEGLRHHLCIDHGEHRDDSASLDDLAETHEGEHEWGVHSRTYTCPEREHEEGDAPDEWDDEGVTENLGDIHRGIGVDLPDDLHKFVHDRRRTPQSRARALLDHVRSHREGIGVHWTTEPGVAEDFAETSAKGYAADRKPGTAVVFHAGPPEREHIDSSIYSDPTVYRHGDHGEREVPLRSGEDADLKGISWAPVHDDWDAPHDKEYTRHDFGGERERHTASAVTASATAEVGAELIGHFEAAAPRVVERVPDLSHDGPDEPPEDDGGWGGGGGGKNRFTVIRNSANYGLVNDAEYHHGSYVGYHASLEDALHHLAHMKSEGTFDPSEVRYAGKTDFKRTRDITPEFHNHYSRWFEPKSAAYKPHSDVIGAGSDMSAGELAEHAKTWHGHLPLDQAKRWGKNPGRQHQADHHANQGASFDRGAHADACPSAWDGWVNHAGNCAYRGPSGHEHAPSMGDMFPSGSDDLLGHFEGSAGTETWYHGTVRDLSPGGLIETGHPVTNSRAQDRLLENGDGNRLSTHVHATPSREIATNYAHRAVSHEKWKLRGTGRVPGAPRVYEVEWTGGHEADPDGGPDDRRSADPLRVVREVGMHFEGALGSETDDRLPLAEVGRLRSSNGPFTVDDWVARHERRGMTPTAPRDPDAPLLIMRGHPDGDQLWDGHHRYARHRELGSESVPVEYEDWDRWKRENYREAAHRPGRGEKTCACCKGKGSHADGSECDPCDGSGMMHSNEPDVICPGQPQPKRRHWREASAAEPEPGVTVEHSERPSGGATYPHMHALTATHPDGTTAELRYMLSKRGSRGVVDASFVPKGYARSLGVPLVREARRLHPAAFVKGLPGLDEDWGKHLPSVGSLHRNLTVRLEPADRDYVHDESVPRAHRAKFLMGLVERGGPSMHWASQRGRAAAEQSFGDHEFRSPEHTQIALSAEPPSPDHVETDPERISKNGGYAYQAPDWEVPLKEGAPVTVSSVRWRTGNAGWTRHQFRGGHQFTAGRASREAAAPGEDYGYQHRPLPSADPIHEGAGISGSREDPRYHTHGEDADRNEATSQFRRSQGNPDHPVRIYRAAPRKSGGAINTGDWVTTAHGYARDLAEDRNYHDPESILTDPKTPAERFHVYEATVPARHVLGGGNDLMEFGYFGNTVQGEHSARCGQDEGRTAALEVSASASDESSNDYKEIRAEAADYSLQHTAPRPEAGHRSLDHFTGNDPDERVRIYRSAPRGVESINPGDWISLNPAYAHEHGRHATDSDKDWPVYTAEVPEKHVHWDRNDENEHGYNGPAVHHPDIHDEETGSLHDWDEWHGDHPHGQEAWAGASAHLRPEDHAFVHGEFEWEPDRADRLMDAARSQGSLRGAAWRDDLYPARDDAEAHAAAHPAPEGHQLTAFTVHRDDDGSVRRIGLHHYQASDDPNENRRYQGIDLEDHGYEHPALTDKAMRKEAAVQHEGELDDDEIRRGLQLPGTPAERSAEEGRAAGERLWEGVNQIFDPGSTEEGRHSDRNTREMSALMGRYGNAPGKIDYDEDEESPYYEAKHHDERGRPTGWTIRHYSDGPNAEIRHEATPGESHDMFDIGEDTYGKHANPHGWTHPPAEFGHEHLKGVLDRWHDDQESGAREHLEGPYGDPRIRRWKRRHLGAVQEPVAEIVAHFSEAEDRGANPVDDAMRTISQIAESKGHRPVWTPDDRGDRPSYLSPNIYLSCQDCDPSVHSRVKRLGLPQDPAEFRHGMVDDHNIPAWVTRQCRRTKEKARALREQLDAMADERQRKSPREGSRRQREGEPPTLSATASAEVVAHFEAGMGERVAALVNPHNDAGQKQFGRHWNREDSPETWYHGSPYAYRHMDSDAPASMAADMDEPSHEHWNNLLGGHFAGHEGTAATFVHESSSGSYEGDRSPGYIYHARLHIRNPRHYPSEFDMDREAYGHEFDHGNYPVNHDPDFEDEWDGDPNLSHHDDLRKQPDTMTIPDEITGGTRNVDNRMRFGRWLSVHPDKAGIAERFKGRLEAAGHHGVTYGNEIEQNNGGTGGTCAIAFHPHQVQITQRHEYNPRHKTDYEDNPYNCKHGAEADWEEGHWPTHDQPELPFGEHRASATPDVIAHFAAAGSWMQQKLFHAKPDPTLNGEQSLRHNPADPHAHIRRRQESEEGYVPPAETFDDPERGNYGEDKGLYHHPAKGWHCRACGDFHDGPDEVDEHDTGYTDWDQEYPRLPEAMHRGMRLDDDGSHGRVLHHYRDDEHGSEATARGVLGHLGELGSHWTPTESQARHYAGIGGYGRPEGHTMHVVVHARKPDREDIETDPETLAEQRVIGFDKHDDAEIPLREGTDVHVTGVSWKYHDEPDSAWRRHDFGDGAQQHTAAVEYGPKPEFVAAPEHLSDDEKMAHWESQRKIKDDWEGNTRHGLSVGHLTYDRARKLGYWGNGDELPDEGWDNDGNLKWRRGWQALPQHLYHVTTNLPAVRESGGLRNRRELEQHRSGGLGLGGGPDDTISLTGDHGTARNILRAMHEYHDVLNGRRSPHDMVEEARTGRGAQRPFLHDWNVFSGEAHQREGDDLARPIRDALEGHESYTSPTLRTRQDMEGQEGPGWEPEDEGRDFAGHHVHNGPWHRTPAPERRRQQLSDLYKNFSWARQHAGGHDNPLFVSNDVERFAHLNPSHFAIVHATPRPGAQGFPESSLGEWRTASGDAVQVHRAERLEGGHLKEASLAVPEIIAHFAMTGGAPPPWDNMREDRPEIGPWPGGKAFHGTRSLLEPGETLTPDEAERHPAHPMAGLSEGHVHITPRGAEAQYWAEHANPFTTHDRMQELGRGRSFSHDRGENQGHAYPPRVYEVEPTGAVEPDPVGEGNSYRTAHPVRVVRQVRPLTCWDCPDTSRSEEHWPEHPHHEYLQSMEDDEDDDEGRTAALTQGSASDERGSNDACPDCGSRRFLWVGGSSRKCGQCGEVWGPDLVRNPPRAFHEPEITEDDPRITDPRVAALSATASDDDEWEDEDDGSYEEPRSLTRIQPERDEHDYVWPRLRDDDSGEEFRDPDEEPRCLNCEGASGTEVRHLPEHGHLPGVQERLDRGKAREDRWDRGEYDRTRYCGVSCEMSHAEDRANGIGVHHTFAEGEDEHDEPRILHGEMPQISGPHEAPVGRQSGNYEVRSPSAEHRCHCCRNILPQYRREAALVEHFEDRPGQIVYADVHDQVPAPAAAPGSFAWSGLQVPEDKEGLTEALREMPTLVGVIREELWKLAVRLSDESPLHPSVIDMIFEMAASCRTAGEDMMRLGIASPEGSWEEPGSGPKA